MPPDATRPPMVRIVALALTFLPIAVLTLMPGSGRCDAASQKLPPVRRGRICRRNQERYSLRPVRCCNSGSYVGLPQDSDCRSGGNREHRNPPEPHSRERPEPLGCSVQLVRGAARWMAVIGVRIGWWQTVFNRRRWPWSRHLLLVSRCWLVAP